MTIITETLVKRGSQTSDEGTTLFVECKMRPRECRGIVKVQDCLRVVLCDLLLAICEVWTMLSLRGARGPQFVL